MKLKNVVGVAIPIMVVAVLGVLMFIRYGIIVRANPGCVRGCMIGDVSLSVIFLLLVAALLRGLYKKDREIERLTSDVRQKTTDLLLSNEKERRKIALALHDRIGQNLALSRKKLDLMAEQLPDPEAAILEPVVSLIDQTISDMCSLNFEISPHILYDEGLEGALDWLCEQLEGEAGLRIEFEDDQVPKSLSEDSRILLYRCARELLMNVIKHSRASLARVHVTRCENSVRIEINDDGVGFMPDRIEKKVAHGFGLSSVLGQIKHRGGDVFVNSHPGKGAQVVIVYPLDGKS